eukprot:s1149_g11.t1
MADQAVLGKADPDFPGAPSPVQLQEEVSDCSRCWCCLQLTTARPQSKSTSFFSLLLVLAAWTSTVLAVYMSRNTFPHPEPAGMGTFSEERAWSILQEVQRIGAHPVIYKSDFMSYYYTAPASNVAVFNLFKQEIEGIKLAASDHVTVELQVPTSGRISSGVLAGGSSGSYYDFVSARLRVKEPSSYTKAMLLTAHFDSVVPEGVSESEDALGSMGAGMSDDAVGCATVLETFRVLATASEPPLVDVILLLTNGEEVNYLGLDSFMASSPWAAHVGFFLQMDQSGSRGHALAVFGDAQSGEKAAAFAYHAGAVHPHTSVLLRDFHPWEDMNTDGSRLRGSYGVPGIGMYMMEDRCPYHTVYDDLSHILRGNLQAHGNNFVGVSRAVTRNEAILDMWAKSDSDPSGDAYTIDLLSSSMLLLTPATMAGFYSLLGVSVIAVVCVVAFTEPQGRTALVDLSLLASAHFASIGAGLVVTFVLAVCVGANFGYWYRRDGMAVWLYIFPSLCVQLSFGRLLLFKRFSGVSAEFIQWRSSIAAVILLVLLTLLLAMAGLHMSLLFGMCALTRLAGFLLRIGIAFIAQRANKEPVANQSDAWPAWLGIISELTLASLGSIYLLDAMRFAVLNFTTSLGQEGAILPGDLTLALYVGLFGSSAILQSSGVQVLSTRCIFAGHVLVISLFISFCLVIAALALPVYDKYPCEVPGIL